MKRKMEHNYPPILPSPPNVAVERRAGFTKKANINKLDKHARNKSHDTRGPGLFFTICLSH